MANLVEEFITPDSGWFGVSYGSTMVPDVEGPDGSTTATAVVFFGIDSHHVWYDLKDADGNPLPLEIGATYQVDVEVMVGHKGFTGPFEIAYYTDGDAVNVGEFDLSATSGWQTVSWEFTAGEDTLNDPSIRLIGWGQGAAQEYLVFNSVLVNKTADAPTDTGDGSTVNEPVSDPASAPRGEPVSFDMEPLEARGGRLVAFPEPTTMEDFTTVIQRDFDSYMEWGEENTYIRPASESPFDERFFRTVMAAGTSSGSDVEGGTGWEGIHIPNGSDHAALRYRVRFQPNYDWVKGGKLPGLFGGDSPSGGASADNGFTARMMWRADGQGELYTYNINREHTYGDSIGRGLFTFTPGIWHTIEQEVIMNTVDETTGDVYADGIVRIWFDGAPIFEVGQMVFRTSNAVKADGIMSTIFFGGSSEEWRTPVDQYVETGDFKIWIPA